MLQVFVFCINYLPKYLYFWHLSLVLTVSHILNLQKKSNGTGIAVSDERVDYVVVDQHRTQALKSTREAWSDERQLTEQDPPNKGTKWHPSLSSFLHGHDSREAEELRTLHTLWTSYQASTFDFRCSCVTLPRSQLPDQLVYTASC